MMNRNYDPRDELRKMEVMKKEGKKSQKKALSIWLILLVIIAVFIGFLLLSH